MTKKDIRKTSLYDVIFHVVWKKSREVTTIDATEEIVYLVTRLLRWDDTQETEQEHYERIKEHLLLPGSK